MPFSRGTSPPRISRQSQTCTTSAPGDWAANCLSTTSFQYIGASSRVQKVSRPSEEPEHRPSESCVGDGHHLHGGSGHRAFVIAIVDLYSRKNMEYSVVNTMDSPHCVETLQFAESRYSVPEIFNSDQGSQLPAGSSRTN